MNLLQMSFYGTLIIAATVLIRAAALDKLPKKVFPILWIIAAMRLTVPYTLPSVFSIYSRVNPVPTDLYYGSRIDSTFVIYSYTVSAAQKPRVSPWFFVWIVGMLICAGFFAAVYFRFRRNFSESLPVQGEFYEKWLCNHTIRRRIAIRQSDRISSPLTYGVLRPVILLPKDIECASDKTEFILTHEFVHIRRFDGLVKLIFTLALCTHWFNPAVWVMYLLANRDMELSCDEAVVRTLGNRYRYAMTLICMEEFRSGIVPFCSHFSSNAIKERISAIMNMKKQSILAAFAAVVLVIGVFGAFATTATDPGSDSAEPENVINGTSQVENGYVPGSVFESATDQNAKESFSPSFGSIDPIEYSKPDTLYAYFEQHGIVIDDSKPLSSPENLAKWLGVFTAYGVSWDEEGIILYQGQPVKAFIFRFPNGTLVNYTSCLDEGICLRSVCDEDGNQLGVEVLDEIPQSIITAYENLM